MHVPVFIGEGKLDFQDRPVPRPAQPLDVLVKVKACGICGTDLNILAVPPAHAARPGIIIGHEAIATVVEAGAAVNGLQAGDRVAVAPRITCGKCVYCRRGLSNQCTDYLSVGTSIDGAFAPYLLLPSSALYRIPDGVEDDDAVFFEPLSCAVGAAERAPVRPGSRIAIIGAGPMGMLFAMLYKAMGAGAIFMVDLVPGRLQQARSLGVEYALNPADGSVKDFIMEKTEIGCDLVIDAVGNQLPLAIDLARRAGTVILFGLRAHDAPPVKQHTITRNDLTVIGSFVGLNPFIQTMQFLESGNIHPGVLISHRLPLEALEEGIGLMRSGQATKVIVEPKT